MKSFFDDKFMGTLIDSLWKEDGSGGYPIHHYSSHGLRALIAIMRDKIIELEALLGEKK